MEAAAATAHDHTAKGIRRLLSALTHFQLSDKFKFAVKASLSLVLVYLISFAQGWSNATTAATTVMLIAATGSLGDSVMKGLLRIIGTISGAVIGMFLIALFPQERELYLLSASVIITLLLYFARAYKGDMTALLLTAITLLMMFQNGEVDNIFLYGIDKTFMTVFGIVVYTFVGLFLWPVSTKDDSMTQAENLTQAQKALFLAKDGTRKERIEKHQAMIEALQTFRGTLGRISAGTEENFSRRQWESVLLDYKEITHYLTLLSYHDKDDLGGELSTYAPNLSELQARIVQLFDSLGEAWQDRVTISVPDTFHVTLDHTRIDTLSQLGKASLSSTIEEMHAIYTHLCSLASKLNALNTPQPTRFPIEENLHQESRFVWLNIEHLKASLVTFLIFWTGSLIWIYINPPGGFIVVTLASGLSVITAFTPIRPSLLIIIYSLAFVFAALMYVLVLPNLTYGWELAIFIFLYAFIGFYCIDPQISVFFLLGMTTLGIGNQMYYAFDIFLLILMIFYGFLFLLLFFYYIPFPTKPEQMFLTMKARLFRYAALLVTHSRNRIAGKSSFVDTLKAAYARHHLMHTVQQMQLWASQIDTKHFDMLEKEPLLHFGKTCESFAYLLDTMYRRDKTQMQNPLVREFLSQNSKYALAPLLHAYAKGVTPAQTDEKWKDKERIATQMEVKLKTFDNSKNDANYTPEQIMQFYTAISLRKHVWNALFACSEEMGTLNLDVLKESRF